jgi:hypothetical protein
MMVRMDRVGFVELFLFIQNRLDDKIELLLAEVVGSNPTRSTFIILVNYGIRLSSIWVVVGQKC